MGKMCRSHIVSSGRHRYLYEQCGPDADCREHVQAGGLDDCLEHARTYQRSLQVLHPTTPQCLTNHSRRLSVFDAKLSVQSCTRPIVFSPGDLPHSIRLRGRSNMYFWFLSWRLYSSRPRGHAPESRTSPPMQPRTVAIRVQNVCEGR